MLKKYIKISWLFKIADIFFSLFCIFPLSILHWHGTWLLQDEYFFPNDKSLSRWLSLALGSTTCILELLFQPQLQEWLSDSHRVFRFIATRLHLYIHGWAILCFWRGVWEFLDFLLSPSFVLPIVVYVICQIFMILMRIVRTAVGVPFSFKLDISDDLLEPDLLFKTKHSHIYLFVLDCLLTQFVVVTINISLWWSIEAIIANSEIFGNKDIFCLFIGSVGSLLILLLEYPLITFLNFFNEKKKLRLFFEELLFIFITWVNLLMWVSLWSICIQYFLPWKHVGSWVAHCIGTIGLMCLLAFNNVGLHGITRDGVDECSDELFNNMYWRILFGKRIEESRQEYEELQISTKESLVPFSDSSSEDIRMSTTTFELESTSNTMIFDLSSSPIEILSDANSENMTYKIETNLLNASNS